MTRRVLPGDFGQFQKAAAESLAATLANPFDCDGCSKQADASERYVVRQQRPSDPTCYSGVIWLCATCGPKWGAKTEAEWDQWITGPEAEKMGVLFLD